MATISYGADGERSGILYDSIMKKNKEIVEKALSDLRNNIIALTLDMDNFELLFLQIARKINLKILDKSGQELIEGSDLVLLSDRLFDVTYEKTGPLDKAIEALLDLDPIADFDPGGKMWTKFATFFEKPECTGLVIFNGDTEKEPVSDSPLTELRLAYNGTSSPMEIYHKIDDILNTFEWPQYRRVATIEEDNQN